MWYLGENLAVAQIPKAGLNTMREWLSGFRVVGNDDPDLLACPQRVMFVRNPLNRLVSCYSFFKALSDIGKNHSCDAPVSSWESFVDHILVNDDPHWVSQVEHSGNKQTVVHRLEDMEFVWFRYYRGPLPWSNKTHRRPASNYRLLEIVKKYLDDYDLWLGAPI